MLLVDTSVWVDIFGKNRKYQVEPDQLLMFAVCPPILQELLQGIREEVNFYQIKEGLLALVRLGDPVLSDDYLSAADIYRSGRRKGITIRSSIDCLIAAIAIREKIPVLHRDRDFKYIAKYTDLQVQEDF